MTAPTRSTTARGYGQSHQKARAKWKATLKRQGTLACANPNCLRPDEPITPDTPWELGHTADRTGYRGPEHVDCNRHEGGKLGAAVTNGPRAMTVRDW